MGESHYSFCSAWSLCLWPLAAALVKNMSWIKQKLPPRKSSKWCPKELKLGVQTRIVCLTQKTCLLFSFLHFKLISSLNKPSPVLCPYPGACCSSLKRLPLPPWCLAKARSNCRNAGISAACSAVPWKNVEKQWIIMDYSKIMINNICFSRVGSQKKKPFEQWCPQILNVLTLDPFIFQWQKRWCPFFLIACLAESSPGFEVLQDFSHEEAKLAKLASLWLSNDTVWESSCAAFSPCCFSQQHVTGWTLCARPAHCTIAVKPRNSALAFAMR